MAGMPDNSGMNMSGDQEFWRGVLLGGAVGDALGAPVEFWSLRDIRHEYGPDGVGAMLPFDGRIGAITDDTQMTLFTAEALMGTWQRGRSHQDARFETGLYFSYRRWLATQERIDVRQDQVDLRGLLWDCPDLHHVRAPGHTCLSALRSAEYGTIERPINNSKGCGGVMRAAPGGWDRGFHTGAIAGAITHGHPSGYLSAGALAEIIGQMADGNTLPGALDAAAERLAEYDGAEETATALSQARELAEHPGDDPALDVERLGGGWTGEEALAIAVYAALRADGDPRTGIRIAVNHSGDSDSTGAIAGNILGALSGPGALPAEWVEPLEARDVIIEVADDLAAGLPQEFTPEWRRHSKRYPYH